MQTTESRGAVWLGVLLGLLALPLITFQPALLVGHGLVGAGTPDIWGHAWGYWWVADCLVNGRSPLSMVPTAWPEQQRWWIVDLPVAIALTPVTLLLGPAAAWAWSFVLRFVAIGAGLGWWLRREGLSTALSTGIVAIVLLGPFVRGLVWSGLPESLSVLLAPVFGGLLGAWMDRERGPVLAALLGVFLVLDGTYGAVAAAIVGTVEVGRRMRPSAALRAVPIALVAGGAQAWVLLTQRSFGHRAVSAGKEQMAELVADGDLRWSIAPLGGADVVQLVAWQSWMPLLDTETIHRHLVYLGGLLLLGAIAAMVRSRRARSLGLMALVAGVIALGQRLSVGGEVWLTAMPGSPLVANGGVHAYRLAGVAVVVLPVALALGLGPRWGAVLLVLVGLDQQLAFPSLVPSQANPEGAVEAWLAEGEGAVLDLPLEQEHRATNHPFEQRTFYLQTRHGRPIASAFQKDAPIGELGITAVRSLETGVGRTWSSRGRRAVPIKALPDGIFRRSSSQLRELGFTAVVLDLQRITEVEQAEARAFMEAWLGEPAAEDRLRLVWALPSGDATD